VRKSARPQLGRDCGGIGAEAEESYGDGFQRLKRKAESGDKTS